MADDTTSATRRLYHRIRSRLPGGGPGDYYRDPAGYWEQRHATFGEDLDGVGRIGMGDEANRQDYGVKWDHLRQALIDAGVGPCAFLDAGCGIGWFSEHLQAEGYTPTGVDFSPSAADIARRHLGDVVVEVGSLDGYRAGRTFELVICIDVLFHLVDDDIWLATVANLAAHVAAGGHLTIQESLVEVPAEAGSSTVKHTRWRSLADYTDALPDWEVVLHDHYPLPNEGGAKDLLIFGRR
jgi:SAM-dependent methyltransferase